MCIRDRDLRDKIALFCNVDSKAVISNYDSSSIYEVPLVLHKEKFDLTVLERLHLPDRKINIENWEQFVASVKNPVEKVEIALCGKYTEHMDAYKSIMESFVHAGAENNCKVIVRPIKAEALESESAEKLFDGVSGILVPGGFGERGIEGKIKAVQYARENDIPFLSLIHI